MSTSGPEAAIDNKRKLTRADSSSVRETYEQVHEGIANVQERYKPILDKLLTNRMPNFLGDFMKTVKGFTSDLSWVAKQPAVASMVFQQEPAEGTTAPLPETLTVGPQQRLPNTEMCGNSTMCTDILEWTRSTNEDFRQGRVPSPLLQVALKNREYEKGGYTLDGTHNHHSHPQGGQHGHHKL
eukprot:CAMPEP_0119314004 /NCGR_PEP_ID=MMETSP1333-20130426/31234_1 /TAXON_ID=418940 /ORGANISM="Scyphosphaera apsteinii, Strain RCC1455" /LENGTH=182 /DNA_ID=CAMNT_0007319013 /DNA_START=72 /DNA_END=620 /DNA_ORIENTATION=+